jgi:hypothetical protein
MLVLCGKVYFPMLIFYRFRIVCDKGWPSQNNFWCEGGNKTQNNNKKYSIDYNPQTVTFWPVAAFSPVFISARFIKYMNETEIGFRVAPLVHSL